MTDEHIIDLYWNRSEQAIAVTDDKYGKMCNGIAYRILNDREDSEECVNDGYLRLWNSIPPQRPKSLPAFLGKIVRNLALNCYEKRNASKRGGGEVPLALDELEECISTGESVEDTFEKKELLRSMNRFLDALPDTERNLFVCRYWYLDPIHDIAQRFGFTESKVTSMLHRIRGKLRKHLEKEGF